MRILESKEGKDQVLRSMRAVRYNQHHELNLWGFRERLTLH